MKVLICTFGSTAHYACRIFHALLRDITDTKLFFFNGRWNKDTESFIIDYLSKESPDLIAVSLLTLELGLCRKLVDTIRRFRSPEETKIIFGGPYAFLDAESCFEMADFVCTGEGEYTLYKLCERFIDAKKWKGVVLKDVPNLSYRHNNVTYKSDIQDYYYSRQFIDDLPFPSYGEDGIHIYNGIEWNGDLLLQNDIYTLFASRGCPNGCSYCINAIHKVRKVTLRSPAKIIEELCIIKKKLPNLKRIFFIDEIFCWQREWAMEFMQLYKEKIALPFECESFPGRHSEDVIKILANTGLRKVQIGVQSCSERILNDIFTRPQKIQDVINDNKTYLKYGVLPTYDFIVDNPFETPEDLLKTIEVVHLLKRPNFFRIYSLFFFPFHPLTLRAEREGLYDKKDWSSDINKGIFDKITTDHAGDQHCKRKWYTNPLKAITGGDKKAALNWLLVCYGNMNIPKKMVDIAFDGYKRGKLFWVLMLAYYYKLIGLFYRLGKTGIIVVVAYRRHGLLKTAKRIMEKLSKSEYMLGYYG